MSSEWKPGTPGRPRKWSIEQGFFSPNKKSKLEIELLQAQKEVSTKFYNAKKAQEFFELQVVEARKAQENMKKII